ncbi:MAG: NAD-dependent epimerase/dehydratase family protein [Salinivirgaceae bacterium]
MILITGGTGFVGAHLTYQLVTEGHSVRLLIRNREKISALATVFRFYDRELSDFDHLIEFSDGDVSDIFSIKEALGDDTQLVFHCAGVVSFSADDKQKLLDVNFFGTKNMVDASLATNVEKFVYVSSIAALGDSLDEMVSEQNHKYEVDRNSHYGISKRKGELEVWRGSQEGLTTIIVNPTVIVGPGQWSAGSPQLFKTVYKGMPFYTKGSTGFVDVRNVAQSMIKLAFSEIENEHFLLNNSNLGYQQFFNMVADNLSVRRPKYEALPWMMNFAAALLGFFGRISGTPSAINKHVAKSALTQTVYDNTKIQSVLKTDYESIEDAIAFTASCFKREHYTV